MQQNSKSHDSLRQQPMSHDTIAQAWQSANQSADCNDIIIGFGSFFTVAEIIQHISG
ncbi:MAG: bifunctional tetrahydrofolate synthase/dihydrofolate synthase, partial [Moritella sp.]|nr:bifunctional tetrahydrofolate synthase/dihydrofolate synthase [Moritella sp.]